ncbi:ATP-binding protein [Roseiconus nitratireducens]|uniref:ATP-binding protein n=1 Tax=Roseiconus nitratireducens TaxID=2605748 RepID=A0A5M6D4U9_9BACT|nr:ATP-binding protein [Roseiconus nitratireducens]KAA5541332.1 ATP-binding protein [Roseiconus nitratireducens]
MIERQPDYENLLDDQLADVLSLESATGEESDQGRVPASEMPLLAEVDGENAPAAPEHLGETGIDDQWLADLAVRMASTVPHFTTGWAAERLHLPVQLVEELLWRLKSDHLVEVLGQDGPFSYRYAATQRGREYAKRLFDLCGYVGPAPVAVESYRRMIGLQAANRDEVKLEAVQAALKSLVLPDETVETAALAASSGRSLFMFGPPGNGKTSVGHLLHQAVRGDIWIPHCIQVDGDIIRIFDPQQHVPAPLHTSDPGRIDRRWIRIQRPFIVAGGEMTMESLDLAYSPAHRFYEAPLHLKANGGTFLIDDLGRQKVESHALLNRWIVPLEQRVDYLALNSGQKVEVPFILMLIVSTNLTVEEVADPAFLRRMGYRLHLTSPTPDQYAEILTKYAADAGLELPQSMVQPLLTRYRDHGFPLRSSEPRDLVDRAKDICRLRGQPMVLTEAIMEAAWRGYFGN